MGYSLSVGLWNEGKTLSDQGKVRKKVRQATENGQVALRASVESAFGFVHHPVVWVDEVQRAVTGFTCDCWETANGKAICAHCAALLADEYHDRDMTVTATEEDNKRLSLSDTAPAGAAAQTPSSDGLTIQSDVYLDSGIREVKGRMKCDFGFVHYPMLTLRDGVVVDHHCDCYYTAEAAALCPHCEALYNRLYAAVPEPEASELDDLFEIDFSRLPETADDVAQNDVLTPMETAEEEIIDYEPRSMQILLGHDRGHGAPVFWYPNDTEQLVHINTGIIGTMGTGKTQLTKSIITQLYRQQRNNFNGRELGILIFDYKGDYNQTKKDFVDATHATVLNLHNLPYNPMALKGLKQKPQLPYHVASAFANILTKIYRLGPVQHNTLLHCIITAYDRCGITSEPATWNREAPTFEQVYQVYTEENVKQDALFSAMYALHQFEIFEKVPSRTTSLYGLLNGVVVLDLSGYDSRIQNLAVAITLEIFCSQMLNSGSSQWNAKYRELTKIILVDEADNIMSEGFPALKTIMKEGREFGVGTVLSTQSLKHFGIGEEDYAAYILTWVVHTVPDLKKSDVEFILKTSGGRSERLSQEIAHLKKHHSVAKIGNLDPLYLQDTAFWEIAQDVRQSYLDEAEETPEEDKDV